MSFLRKPDCLLDDNSFLSVSKPAFFNKGSISDLMVYAQGIWSAPGKGIRHQYTSYSLTERLFKILGKELNIHLMPLL